LRREYLAFLLKAQGSRRRLPTRTNTEPFMADPIWSTVYGQPTPRPGARDKRIWTCLDQRYRIRKKLGSGGMGVVYRAQDLTERRTCAVKLMKSDEGELARRFRREVIAG